MNINSGQKCFKITILKTVTFFHWRRVHYLQFTKTKVSVIVEYQNIQFSGLVCQNTELAYFFFLFPFSGVEGPGEDTTVIYKKGGLGTYSWNYMVWQGTASLSSSWAEKKTQVHFLSSSPLNCSCSSWVFALQDVCADVKKFFFLFLFCHISVEL